MNPGQLDTRVTFRRRAVLNARERSDDYSDFLTVWAKYTRLSGREALQAGRVTDIETGTLRIRDSARAREITNEDRVRVKGRNHAVQAVSLPERRTGFIDIAVSTDVGE